MREKGFALATTLVLGVAILVMGIAGMFVSEMGFRSISSEQAWHRAEKAANAGLQTVSGRIIQRNFNCGDGANFTFNGANVEVRTLSDNNQGHCFLWARATIGNNTNVVKVAILSMGNPAEDFGTLTFRQIRNLNIGGSGAITSCDATCKTPAIVIDNRPSNLNDPDPVPTCPNNPRGIIALVNPVVVNEELRNRDLTSTVFDNINNRTELLDRLSNEFRVSFNNGRPNGIVGQAVTVTQRPGVPANNIKLGQTYEVCNASCFDVVEAAGSTLNCYSEVPGMKLEFTWSGDRYNVVQYEEIEICADPPCRPGRGGGRGLIGRRTSLFSCYNIDFGQNSSISFNNFTGGNTIAGNYISIEGKGNLTSATASIGGYPRSLSLIARNQLEDNSINITVQNVNVFAQNISLSGSGLKWEGGLLYSGGSDGKFNIDLRSNSYLGSQTNPVLLITDNNMEIQRNGTASINGLVFATDANKELKIGYGNGNFSLNGAIVSNSNGENEVNISGNFSINFNRRVLENLRNKFGFLKPPPCSTSASVRMPFIQTKMTVY